MMKKQNIKRSRQNMSGLRTTNQKEITKDYENNTVDIS